MPELDNLNPNRPNLCSSLRWKGLFYPGGEALKDPDMQASNSAYFWCLHTQLCLGPDGGLAEPGECDKSGRSCHKGEVPLA
jgi:hypothetical protein